MAWMSFGEKGDGLVLLWLQLHVGPAVLSWIKVKTVVWPVYHSELLLVLGKMGHHLPAGMTGRTNLKEVLSLVNLNKRDKVALKHFQIPLHVHGHVRAGRRAPRQPCRWSSPRPWCCWKSVSQWWLCYCTSACSGTLWGPPNLDAPGADNTDSRFVTEHDRPPLILSPIDVLLGGGSSSLSSFLWAEVPWQHCVEGWWSFFWRKCWSSLTDLSPHPLTLAFGSLADLKKFSLHVILQPPACVAVVHLGRSELFLGE